MCKFNYEYLKSEAARRRKAGDACSVTDLIALSAANDPFYVGRPSEVAGAEWFADLWHRFGYRSGVHLRRVHYQIVSQEPQVLRPDGLPYENTQACWDYLTQASKWARYLDLVGAGQFVDRRNPDATVNAQHIDVNTQLGCDAYVPWTSLELPRYSIDGYRGHLQPYHVEIWSEKTTMDDVLKPLCKRYQADYVTGAGELSITSVIQFLDRVKAADKPARILYVSDFDPAGMGMPVSVARKIEFYQRQDANRQGLDIGLQPIVLTANQVHEYSLPRVPVKDSDKRKGAWIEAHGAGQVELDALEALHPGVLDNIMRAAILRYYDPGIDSVARDQENALERELADIRDDIMSEFSEQIDAIQAQIDDVQQAIQARLEEETPYTDHIALPNPQVTGDDGLLYDSKRDYWQQLEAYEDHKRGA